MYVLGAGQAVTDSQRVSVCCFFAVWKVFMNKQIGITEHWTITGQSVVLTGSGSSIKSLVSQLGLPNDSSIRLSGRRAAVALWGEPLSAYLHQHRVHVTLPDSTKDSAEPVDVLVSASAV